jgi:hypothetical protein
MTRLNTLSTCLSVYLVTFSLLHIVVNKNIEKRMKNSLFRGIIQHSLLKFNWHVGEGHVTIFKVSSSAYSSTLIIEAKLFSEISADFQRTTRSNVLEDGTPSNHRCEDIQFHVSVEGWKHAERSYCGLFVRWSTLHGFPFGLSKATDHNYQDNLPPYQTSDPANAQY